MVKLLEPLSGIAGAGWTGEHKHRAFSSRHSRCWQPPARLKKRCCHSSYIDSVQGPGLKGFNAL